MVMGAALGYLLFRWNVFLGALVMGLPLAGLMWAMAHRFVERGGAISAVLHTPSGEQTPYPGSLSREEALIAGGRLEDAVVALAEAAAEAPGDARPPLRLAELYRDDLGRPEEAVAWFRRAAAVPGLRPEEERHILLELLELCRALGEPRLAAPALARTVELRAGSRVGIWARQELRRIRGEGSADDVPGLAKAKGKVGRLGRKPDPGSGSRGPPAP